MRLIDVRIDGFRGLRRRFAPGVSALTVVTGSAGAGKTSVLDAIACHKEHVAPYLRAVGADALSPFGEPVSIRTQWQLDAVERARTGAGDEPLVAESRVADGRTHKTADPYLVDTLMRLDLSGPTSAVEIVPTSRMTPSSRMPGRDPRFEQRQIRLSSAPGKYNGLHLVLAHADAERVAVLNELLAALVPNVRITERDAAGPRFSGRRLSEMPASTRSVYPLAATLALLRFERSVILFDSPELGLGPGEARRVVDGLRSFEPSNQWLVTTRDPSLINHDDALVVNLDVESAEAA